MKIHVPDDIPALKTFKGYIEFPTGGELTGRMFCEWWKAHNEEVKNKEADTRWHKLWRGAHALISGWGEISIEGIAKGDINATGDMIPLALLVWIGGCVDHELGDILSLKKTVSKSLNM